MTRDRRAAIVHWLRMAPLVAVLALIAPGCGAGGLLEQRSLEANPAFIVRVLPARPGLDVAGPEREVGAGGYARAVLGRDDAALATSLSEAGLREAATRTWTGPGGAVLVATAGLWDDGQAANAIGGEAVRAVVPGGSAWTPAEYGGSQGSRSADSRALSVIVGRVSLFVRAQGPVDDQTVLRTIDLMRQAAAGEDRKGTSSVG